MAFLSRYTFSKLTSVIEPISKKDVTKEFFCNNILNNELLYHTFNRSDLKKVYVTAFLLKNDFNTDVLKYVEEEKDNYKWVFQQGGKLKYHLFADCDGLKANFEDFQIPFNYKSLPNGTGLVKIYREWFKEHRFKEQFAADPLAILSIAYEFNKNFAPQYNLEPITPDDIIHIDIKSSKFKETIYIENEFNQIEFENEMHLLLELRSNMCCSKEKTILSKFDFLYNKSNEEIYKFLENIFDPLFFINYGIENIKSFLEQHYKLRNHCHRLIMTYIKWKFNFPQKEFNVIKLKDFNLKCCVYCKNRALLTEF